MGIVQQRQTKKAFMLAHKNGTIAVGEPKSARLEARTQPSVKDTIRRAATLSGVEVSSLVVSAAHRAARKVIEANEVTVLESEADGTAFFDALENPPKPNRRLGKAFALRKKMIANAD